MDRPSDLVTIVDIMEDPKPRPFDAPPEERKGVTEELKELLEGGEMNLFGELLYNWVRIRCDPGCAAFNLSQFLTFSPYLQSLPGRAFTSSSAPRRWDGVSRLSFEPAGASPLQLMMRSQRVNRDGGLSMPWARGHTCLGTGGDW